MFDGSSGSIDSAFSWNLDFYVLENNSSLSAEEDNSLSDLDVLILEQEGSNDACLITQINSCLLSNWFNFQNLN